MFLLPSKHTPFARFFLCSFVDDRPSSAVHRLILFGRSWVLNWDWLPFMAILIMLKNFTWTIVFVWTHHETLSWLRKPAMLPPSPVSFTSWLGWSSNKSLTALTGNESQSNWTGRAYDKFQLKAQCCGRIFCKLRQLTEAGICRIWGSHSGGYEEYHLLGYNDV
jgi:hypothetical protein